MSLIIRPGRAASRVRIVRRSVFEHAETLIVATMLSTLALHKSWVVFVGTFFLGESVVLAASALAAQGVWSVIAVAGWAFAGTVISDTVWLRSAAMGLGRWRSDPDGSGKLAKTTDRLDRLTGQHPHRALVIVKFLYGTRIASLVYMAVRNVPTRRFVAFDAIGTAIWLAVIIPIGWAIGRGMANLGADLKRLEWLILAIVLAATLYKGVARCRTNRVA